MRVSNSRLRDCTEKERLQQTALPQVQPEGLTHTRGELYRPQSTAMRKPIVEIPITTAITTMNQYELRHEARR